MLISRRCLCVTLILVAIPVIRAYGSCAGPNSFCEKLPQRDDRNSAVFVGEVRKSSVSWVRFRVVEPFLNTAPSDDFIAQLTSDMYVDGGPVGLPSFKVGTRWLVEAKRRSPRRLMDHWRLYADQGTGSRRG